MKKNILIKTFTALVLVVSAAGIANAADPAGAKTLADAPGSPSDYVWILVSVFLVFFMQAGFALVESGFCRAKNVINLLMKNLVDFAVGSIGYFLIGFAFMFGDDVGGIIGSSGWLLLGDSFDVGTYLLFMFQVVFVGTAATIVSGAVAERMKFQHYIVVSAIVSAFIYPIYGHWVWGSGWLASLPFGNGFVDFAGSGVVHLIGGTVGLAGAMVLGPRFGKYGKDGKPKAIPGHSMALAALGVFILWFGWFGFNSGSTFSAHELRISVIAVNTNMAAVTGAIGALASIWIKTKKATQEWL